MLTEFNVNNGIMTSEFSPEIFYYEIMLDEGEDHLAFDYKSTGKVTIYGNENLTYGDNHILIEVYDTSVVTYTFIVHKEKTDEALATFLEYEDASIKSKILDDIKAPGIAVITFLIIITLFCIIFKRK